MYLLSLFQLGFIFCFCRCNLQIISYRRKVHNKNLLKLLDYFCYLLFDLIPPASKVSREVANFKTHICAPVVHSPSYHLPTKFPTTKSYQLPVFTLLPCMLYTHNKHIFCSCTVLKQGFPLSLDD